MSLYTQWKDLIENQTEESFESFWKSYSETETRIYASLLEKQSQEIEGSFQDLAASYEADPVLFMGFLDGINSSLEESLPIEGYDLSSHIKMRIVFDRLYYNMLKAEADYLYTLKEWDALLSENRREELRKEFKRSKTVTKEKVPGRNDPCPCGSGKKYKKCCGA